MAVSSLRRWLSVSRLVSSQECELLWPSGEALDWSADDVGSIPRFGSPFSSKVVICRHFPVTFSLTVNKTLKWLSSLPTTMQVPFWW